MKPHRFWLIPVLLALHAVLSTLCLGYAAEHPQPATHRQGPSSLSRFQGIKASYDTLIPLFDGLFITHHPIDSLSYSTFSSEIPPSSFPYAYSETPITIHTQKWGVIDSSGKVIVPFICDAVKAISENRGLISVYAASGSLNTGIPRYRYAGHTYYFSKAGIANDTKKAFSFIIEYMSDDHHPEFVIRQGPEFYLPNEYRKAVGY